MITDLPMLLPPADKAGHTALRRWRDNLNWTGTEAAIHFEVSPATYYRYENGTNVTLRKANMIIQRTSGQLRYRDILTDYNPEYARC